MCQSLLHIAIFGGGGVLGSSSITLWNQWEIYTGSGLSSMVHLQPQKTLDEAPFAKTQESRRVSNVGIEHCTMSVKFDFICPVPTLGESDWLMVKERGKRTFCCTSHSFSCLFWIWNESVTTTDPRWEEGRELLWGLGGWEMRWISRHLRQK